MAEQRFDLGTYLKNMPFEDTTHSVIRVAGVPDGAVFTARTKGGNLGYFDADGSATVSGTNTGDVTLLGETYLTIVDQVITAHEIDISEHTNLAVTAPIVLTGDTLSHGNSGVAASTYTSVTVDARGHVTAGSNPTTPPLASAFVTIGNDATLTGERALTGTANQVVITDGGANSTVTLSLPQNIHTTATPQFAQLGLGAAIVAGVEINLEDTATDSDVILQLKNDARTWRLRVAGGSSDRFQLEDVTGSTTPIVVDAGAATRCITLTTTGVDINQNQGAFNTRIRTDNEANAVFVDGTNDRVGFFTASPTVEVDLLKSESGSDVTLRTRNSSNTAASDARHTISVGGTSAGDPYLFFEITSGTSWSIGPDNSDGDSFVICSNTVLGATNRWMRMDGTGNVGFYDRLNLPIMNIGGGAAPVGKTLASDAFTVTVGQGYYDLTAQTGTTDDLVTITFSGATDGDILALTVRAAHIITIRETGNIVVVGTTRTLTTSQHIWLKYNSATSKWVEILYSAV